MSIQETVMSSVCCIFSSFALISFFKSLSQVFALRMLQKCFSHKLVIFDSPEVPSIKLDRYDAICYGKHIHA